MTPTQRSLALLRKVGWTVQVVERWNPHARVRQDLFGCIDIVCITEGFEGVLAVQTTTSKNVASRIAKISENPTAALWLRSGNSLSVHGWSRRGERGRRKLWQCRIIEASVDGGKIEWTERVPVNPSVFRVAPATEGRREMQHHSTDVCLQLIAEDTVYALHSAGPNGATLLHLNEAVPLGPAELVTSVDGNVHRGEVNVTRCDCGRLEWTITRRLSTGSVPRKSGSVRRGTPSKTSTRIC